MSIFLIYPHSRLSLSLLDQNLALVFRYESESKILETHANNVVTKRYKTHNYRIFSSRFAMRKRVPKRILKNTKILNSGLQILNVAPFAFVQFSLLFLRRRSGSIRSIRKETGGGLRYACVMVVVQRIPRIMLRTSETRRRNFHAWAFLSRSGIPNHHAPTHLLKYYYACMS